VLAAAGLAARFTVIVDGDVIAASGYRGKPAPDAFVGGAERIGRDPAVCVVVEDALAGVRAGAAGGFGLVVGVDHGAGAGRLREHGADVVVDSLAQLVPWIAEGRT
jgi:beta-phosphoglucomutase-like phosphatase (HAD superfamily)